MFADETRNGPSMRHFRTISFLAFIIIFIRQKRQHSMKGESDKQLRKQKRKT